MKIFRELRRVQAFTLIEIMVVVAVMGLMLALGLPAIFNGLKKEGMRRAVNDIVEVCRRAREQAIMGGTVAEVHFRPQEKTFSAGNFSGRLPETITLEMLDVNLTEFKQAEEARVRFYPNGMCEEMTVILHSDRGEWRKISLEITTGRSSVGDVR